MNVRDDERALAVVERLLLLRPDSPGERRDRGMLLVKLGRSSEAKEQLQRYLEFAPQAAGRARASGRWCDGSSERATLDRPSSRSERSMSGPSRGDHEHAGALFGRVRGVEVARHYGDPAEEYTSAVSGVAVRDRSHRSRLLGDGTGARRHPEWRSHRPDAPSAGGVARRCREGDGGVLGGPNSQGKSRRRSKSHVGAEPGGGEPLVGCAGFRFGSAAGEPATLRPTPPRGCRGRIRRCGTSHGAGTGGGRRAGGGAARLGWRGGRPGELGRV